MKLKSITLPFEAIGEHPERLHGLVDQEHVTRHDDPVPALGVLLCISQSRVLVQHLDVWINLQEQRHDPSPEACEVMCSSLGCLWRW